MIAPRFIDDIFLERAGSLNTFGAISSSYKLEGES